MNKKEIDENKDHYWIVDYSISEGVVCLCVIDAKTAQTYTSHQIKPPNWIERRLGIVYKTKIEKGMRKQKRLCEQLDERDQLDRVLVMDIERMLPIVNQNKQT